MTKIEWQPMQATPSFPTAPGFKVIAHTPIIQPPGYTPGYIILRETDTQYIVHNTEVDEQGKFVGLYWGHYINKDEPDALKRAMQKFVEKTIRWHSLGAIDS